MGFHRATFVVGLAPVGWPLLVPAALAVALAGGLALARTWPGRLAYAGSLVLIALAADTGVRPLTSMKTEMITVPLR